MNILLINNITKKGEALTVGGVEYHRMVKPHSVLQSLNPEFDFMMCANYFSVTDEILNQTDLVLFSRSLGVYDEIETIAEDLNKRCLPFGLDLDDYWYLPTNHVASSHYKQWKSSEATELSIKAAHFVICTTEYLALKIKELNTNVYVIENGIDTTDQVWQTNKTESDRIRYGFTQGDSHLEDIKTVANDVVRSFKDVTFFYKAQVCLTGFNAVELYQTSKTVAMQYEAMLTDKLKVIRHSHNDYFNDLRLLRHTEETNAPYKRIWVKDVLEFGNVYNDIDISVVPLIDSEFNSCKSELKMIEAGFKGCAIMVSNVKPYSQHMTFHNCYSLEVRSFYDWQKWIFQNPESLKDKTAQLKEDMAKFDLVRLTPKRKELYLQFKK